MSPIVYSDGNTKIEITLEKGWYYFDDETCQDFTGPFLNEEEAKSHLEKYKIFLNLEPCVGVFQTPEEPA